MSEDDSDRELGLYNKFTVIRNDGQSEPGRKHFGCSYFVLDMSHDDFAMETIQTYMRACKKEYPKLYEGLRDKYFDGKDI